MSQTLGQHYFFLNLPQRVIAIPAANRWEKARLGLAENHLEVRPFDNEWLRLSVVISYVSEVCWVPPSDESEDSEKEHEVIPNPS